jgi:hypothetical protein
MLTQPTLCRQVQMDREALLCFIIAILRIHYACQGGSFHVVTIAGRAHNRVCRQICLVDDWLGEKESAFQSRDLRRRLRSDVDLIVQPCGILAVYIRHYA